MATDRIGVRTDEITETFFGTEVSDPYRYLENAEDPETAAWTARQNAATRAALDALPARGVLAERFEALLNIGSVGVPEERCGRFFYTARRGSMDQAALFVRENGIDRLLIDPTAPDASGLTALDWWYPSPKGRYVAFGLSKNGDEQSTLYVFEVAEGKRLSEAIPRTRAASLAWLPDESGFYYTRRPPDGDYDVRVYRHELHAAWESDELIFGEGRAPEDWPGVEVSENGRWLLISVQRGWTATDVYLCDLHAGDSAFKAIAENRDAIYEVRFRGDVLYIRTNDGAPRYTLLAAPAEDPARERRRTILPEGESVLDGFALTRERIVATYVRDAHARLIVADDDGNVKGINLPSFGTIGGLSGGEHSSDAYVLYASFTQPTTAYKLNPVAGTIDIWNMTDSPIDASPYRAEQEWVLSADGTRFPMYVLSRADAPRDGSAPAVLTGYGGFNVSYLPSYFSSLIPWLDAGGVYAIANVRGGGEFGEEWHRAGMLGNKQRVFDDFIAATEFLGTSGRADPRRIGVTGASNGGLLVAAVAVQRPELFAAVVSEVPLCDMIRFPRFLIARLWIAEYGDPEKAEDFAWLHAYSPYHHVRDGQAYPAMFFRTADSDSRVDPLHARKMGARMQAATSSDRPVLVHVESGAGHGAGKPRGKQAEDLSDRWSFFAWRLGASIRHG